jgi:hypothetical protein
MLTREQVKEMLRSGEVTIEFEKADGSMRNMRATLSCSIIPEVPPATNRTRKPNDDVLAVYDVQVGGWRSFRWNNLRLVGKEELPNGIQ